MYVDVLLDTYEYDDPSWEANPNDSWDRADTFQELRGVKVKGTEEKPTGWRAVDTDLDVDYGDTVYVVIATYSTGDTFGHDDGRLEVFDVFADYKEAHEFASWLRRTEATHSAIVPDVAGITSKYVNKEYYIPWFGYFEQLQEINVHAEMVEY